MAHNVTCVICHHIFDRDIVQAVRYGSRRYAHASCDPNNTDFVEMPPPKEKKSKEEGFEELKNYITKILGNQANWPLIMKQIKNYKEEYNYTYTGMLKSLIYAYEIQKNDISKWKGVGIIPITYKPAFDYYYSIWEAKQKSADFRLEDAILSTVTVSIPSPRAVIKKRKLFEFLEEDTENGI